jgi:probable phosphoglycerate mutase
MPETTFLLIRHATYARMDEALVGRTPDIHLDARGRAQAARLAVRLASTPIRAIYCSPLDRALETAEPLARRLVLPVHVCADLIDLDAGIWTGCRFDALARDATWQAYNRARSRLGAPGGESMSQVTRRIVRALARLNGRCPGTTVALVSHCDVIRAALLYYSRSPIDEMHRIEVPPASVVSITMTGVRIASPVRGGTMPSAHPVTDHDEIRSWVERHGGRPATVKGRHGLLRIDFGKPEESLEPIEWEEWFKVFDERGLAALIPSDEESRFFKLVSRETVEK